MNIKILGAGIGGLCAAIAFRKKGVDVTIYERNQKRSDLGAGIVCWPNACFVLQSLGVLDRVKQCAGAVVAMRRFSDNGKDLGALDILELNRQMQFPSLSILRRNLMAILESQLEGLGVKVEYDKEVIGLQAAPSGDTFIQFEHAANSRADIIIGADGRMSSVARRFVHGNCAPIYQGFVNWVGIYESDTPVFSDMAICDYWGTGKRFGIVPVSPTTAYWAAATSAPEILANDPSTYRADLWSLFQGWPQPIKRIIDSTPLDEINKVFVHDHNPMDTWHRDNVLVIGDAAHAPLPTSGQGACQALEDAWHLAELLDKEPSELNALFLRFTETRLSKTTGITHQARRFAESLFGLDELASEKRNDESTQVDYAAVVSGMARGWSAGLPMGP